MRTIVLIILANFILFSYSKGQENTKTILAIFRHADDETSVRMVLSKYSKENKIHVMYTVDNIDTSGLDLTSTSTTCTALLEQRALALSKPGQTNK